MPTATTDPISRRVRELTPSVTLAITAKARELRAAGEDVISFGSGEPDFPTPQHVVQAAREACADPQAHRYSATGGLAELRRAIADRAARQSGFECSPDQVVVSNGGKHGLYSVFQTMVDPGDEVLLPAPYWVSYPEQIQLAGGVVVPVPSTSETAWRVTVEQLEAARTPRTKMLVFTSPSNPTGAVYPPGQVAAIGRWAAEHGIWVLTDEIYGLLVYGDAEHSSMPAVAPEVAERCIVADGVAKAYAMTGWRVGWTIAPPRVTEALVDLQSHVTSNVANVSQLAAVAALDGPTDVLDEMRAAYERRRAITHERLSAMDGVDCPMPEGAFYAFPSVEGVLGRRLGGQQITTSVELCEYLLERAKVALVPGESFGAPGSMRLSYALADDDLERGLDRIADALADG